MTYTLLSCIDSKIIDPTKFYGRFELGTFAPGQGLTVANALRRSLLSELPGTAITLVQIKGASHEYDTLSGMRECILDLLLNLKQIILTSDFEIFTAQVGFLNVKGPGIVRARDLKLPFFIYCIDPDQYIATLTNQGQLNMKFLINCGKNHLTHTPSSSQYYDWVNLLKKEQPTILKSSSSQNFAPAAAKAGFYEIKNFSKSKNFFENEKAGSRLLREAASRFAPVAREATSCSKVETTLFADQRQENVAISVYQKWKTEREAYFKNDLHTIPYTGQNLDLKPNDHKPIKNDLINKQNTLICLENSILDKNSNDQTILTKQNGSKKIFLQQENQTAKIGYFPIDAIFAPITRVNYMIESQEESNIAKEIIILEIWTNGTINPRNAIHKAVKSLIQLFLPLQQIKTSIFNSKLQASFVKKDHINKSSQITNKTDTNTELEFNKINQNPIALKKSNNKNTKSLQLNDEPNFENIFQENLKTRRRFDHLTEFKTNEQKPFSNQPFKIKSLSKAKILELDLINLDLSSRPYLALKKANINTIRDLVIKSKQDLLTLKNFGQASLLEVENALKKYPGLNIQ